MIKSWYVLINLIPNFFLLPLASALEVSAHKLLIYRVMSQILFWDRFCFARWLWSRLHFPPPGGAQAQLNIRDTDDPHHCSWKWNMNFGRQQKSSYNNKNGIFLQNVNQNTKIKLTWILKRPHVHKQQPEVNSHFHCCSTPIWIYSHIIHTLVIFFFSCKGFIF